MKSSKFLFALSAFAFAASSFAAGAPTTGPATASSPVLLSEGFDNVNALTANGWAFVNASTPVGNSWFQGNDGIFASHSGAANSYIGADYLSSQFGQGSVDNWLLSPVLNFNTASTLAFYARTGDAGFSDKIEVRFSSGSGSDIAGFSTLLTTADNLSSDSFQKFTANVPVSGTGRFAFRYVVGDANNAAYIGIDTVSVTAVPEPSTYAMMGLGLAALALVRRKAKKA